MNAISPENSSPLPDHAVIPVATSAPDRPLSIYEVHLPSWMRVPEENRPLTCFEITPKLLEHVQRLGFSHVQLRGAHGSDPAGLQYLIKNLHEREIGVILDPAERFESIWKSESISVDGWSQNGNLDMSGHRYHYDAGWTEDTLRYFATDPLYRKFNHDYFRRRDRYAFDRNLILSLSRQALYPSRPSLLSTMPGDRWQKFANLRLVLAWTFLFPGKKLLFMGDEFGQVNPWQPGISLDWHLLAQPGLSHQLMNWTAALNRFYHEEQALHLTDSNPSGFQWIDTADADCSVVSFLRKNPDSGEILLAALNFTPVPRHNYRVGVPREGLWVEKLNSDAKEYGGSGHGNLGATEAAPFGWNFQPCSVMLTLPPLAAIVLKASNSA